MLGSGSSFAEECFKGGFIGTDYGIRMDLTRELSDNWRDFNHKLIPIWMKQNPGKSKVSAGLSCGALWTASKGMLIGDIILSPNGSGSYCVGEVTSNYFYQHNEILPHRRSVKWHTNLIDKAKMSDQLRKSLGSIGTVSDITKYAEEIEQLISGNSAPKLVPTDPTIVDPTTFALEKHLEDFLVQNWRQTELGLKYDIYEEDGALVGQQFKSDTGFIDILAISKDKKELVVVELKKGRVSDSVVGQIQRYMGFVLEELAEKDQTVKGIIIGLDDDVKIRRALAVTNNIEFYRYQVSFKLYKG
jgi:restriction system protein